MSTKGVDVKLKKMRKLLLISGIVAVVLFATSCAQQCICTYYEDGKKISVTESDNVKYFEKSVCKNKSVESHQSFSTVVKNKEVTAEVKCK